MCKFKYRNATSIMSKVQKIKKYNISLTTAFDPLFRYRVPAYWFDLRAINVTYTGLPKMETSRFKG